MNIIEKPSPNNNLRPGGSKITTIVIHDTGCHDGKAAIAWLLNPSSNVSAHYVVDRDGSIFRLVDEVRRAWHAGESVLFGVQNVNNYSIGIEVVNDGQEPFPDLQLVSLCDLVVDISTRYKIPLNRVVGHQHIAMPAGRKVDPGPAFPWFDFLNRVGRALQGAKP